MTSNVVKCRVITPMFSRSLELEDEKKQIYKFELRPQSIKGVLHFWFRALAPRIIDIYNLDLSKLPPELRAEYENEEFKGLKYIENMLFGSQNNRAPFSLLVNWKEYDTQTIGEVSQDNRGRNIFVFSNDLGRDASYPLYGMYDFNRRTGVTKLVNKYLKPGAMFTITVFTKDEPTWNVVFSILKLISVLSGFGAKTSKGFGEFEIVDSRVDRNYYLSEENIKELIAETEKTVLKFINLKDKYRALIFGRSNNVLFPSLVDGKYRFFNTNIEASSLKQLVSMLYGTYPRGWYRELKYRIRKHSGKDCVKELIKCIEREKGQADVNPAIIALPLQYQNLKVKSGNPNKITIFPKNAIGEKGRKPGTLRIIVANQERKYRAYGLLLASKISEDDKLLHDLQDSYNFTLTYSVNFSDLIEEIE